jgi:hypothetical protein
MDMTMSKKRKRKTFRQEVQGLARETASLPYAERRRVIDIVLALLRVLKRLTRGRAR